MDSLEEVLETIYTNINVHKAIIVIDESNSCREVLKSNEYQFTECLEDFNDKRIYLTNHKLLKENFLNDEDFSEIDVIICDRVQPYILTTFLEKYHVKIMVLMK